MAKEAYAPAPITATAHQITLEITLFMRLQALTFCGSGDEPQSGFNAVAQSVGWFFPLADAEVNLPARRAFMAFATL